MSDPCVKFRRLLQAELDDMATPEDGAFLRDHAETCEKCDRARCESMQALAFLRVGAQEEPLPVEFAPERRIVRAVRLDRSFRSFAYWSPAAVGAILAVLMVYAAIQSASAPPTATRPGPAQEARRMPLVLDDPAPLVP